VSQAGLIVYRRDRAGSHRIRNCGARQTLRDAEGTCSAPIRGSAADQAPNRLGIVAFSEEKPPSVGQGDRDSHGSAISLENFAPGFPIEQILSHCGGQFQNAVFGCQAWRGRACRQRRGQTCSCLKSPRGFRNHTLSRTVAAPLIRFGRANLVGALPRRLE
jgi:hypothetical protein